MQLYALDDEGNRCNVSLAKRGKDYFCIECGARVRVRGGEFLRIHFFHIYDGKSCSQAGKSKEHLAVQRLIAYQIGKNSASLEVPFAEIGRIADVCWPQKRLIFEVQCSPISQELVRARNSDYASIGWSVVWVLYDKTFNQKRLSPAELFLLDSTHYFTDGAAIYDQISKVFRRRRLMRSLRQSLDLSKILPIAFDGKEPHLSNMLNRRFCSWKYYVVEDYLFMAMQAKRKKLKLFKQLKYVCKSLWEVVLERSCR